MTGRIHKRFLSLLLASILIVVSLVPSGQAAADVNAQAQDENLGRDWDPVIIKGSQVPELIGAPVGRLYVFTFSDNTRSSNPIAAQVDEVTDDGSYTSSEDGFLDANDEIVFMAGDVGDQPSSTSSLSSFSTWYEIEVSDPLSPGARGWAYLVRSSSSLSPSGNYVDYSTSTRRITTDPYHYKLGFSYGSSGHFGLDYLTLPNNSTQDILDRTKVRVARPLVPTIDEEDLGAPEPVEIRDGRVRVILQRTAFGPGFMTVTYLAYASMVHLYTDVDCTVTVSSVRTSVDLNSAASGATYYNLNIPGGVTINASGPDGVLATPFSNWAQVSHANGRLVQVIDPTSAGGTPKNYYCDNPTSPTECDGTDATGDNGFYGDAGILIDGSVNQIFTIESSLYVLPPPGLDDPDNVGATYEEYFSHPLNVLAFAQGERNMTFLPIVVKN